MKTIILAEGSGTRLWPLSRSRYPKQFIKLMGAETSLFQDTFMRARMLSDLEDIYVVTNRRMKFLVMGEIEELGYYYDEKQILVEPEAKNTLPAICYGVNSACGWGYDSVVVFPSDHVVGKPEKLAGAIRESEELSKRAIITFGVKPNKPHTGYGYIQPGKRKGNGFRVEAFREKPDEKRAVSYMEEGCLWNSGIFMFDSGVFMEEVKMHAPSIYYAFSRNGDAKEAFSRISEGISIDYGIMEKTGIAAVVPIDVGWNDLGSFESFYEVYEGDSHGNIDGGKSIFIEAGSNLVHAENGKAVAIVGAKDLVVIDDRDALLVCGKDSSQRVRDVVGILEEMDYPRVEYPVSDYRPWGHYKVLEEEKNSFKIKRITIMPGKKLSLQVHRHRSEHWVVVNGTAKATIEGSVKTVKTGESVFVRAGERHRLENSGTDKLEIVEVQMGDYLEEDDIVRYDDEYGR